MDGYTALTVGGLRGLNTKQTVEFAVPDGRSGSGISILIGANNSGKSTFIEAIRAINQQNPPSFSEGKRNKAFGDRVEIKLDRIEQGEERAHELASIQAGGSESAVGSSGRTPGDIFVVPSRRAFSAFFGSQGNNPGRNWYASAHELPALKNPTIDQFAMRLFAIDRDGDKRKSFNELLGKIVKPVPDWTIDQNDTGQYYLKFRWGVADNQQQSHSSDGLGEGLISLFFIVDALYDSPVGSTIVVDEPELSLHPQFQRRLREVFSEFSSDRQIIYSTHSPYFVSWLDIENGARITRVYKERSRGSVAAQPSSEALRDVVRLASDTHNPHVLGNDASEVFFLEDGVLLAEGQEDVVYLQKIARDLEMPLSGTFFGWGVGGAEKMRKFSRLLSEMQYKRVVGILDNDKQALRSELEATFPDYLYACIAADDVRTKPARTMDEKDGLLDSSGAIHPAYVAATTELLRQANSYVDRDEPDGLTV